MVETLLSLLFLAMLDCVALAIFLTAAYFIELYHTMHADSEAPTLTAYIVLALMTSGVILVSVHKLGDIIYPHLELL